jgi:hypothetical protein
LRTLETTNSYYLEQQSIAVTTALSVKSLWGQMSDDFDRSWQNIGPAALQTVELGRAASVARSVNYTGAVLAETGQDETVEGGLNVSRFLASAPNGQPMADVLSGAVVQAKVAVKGGATASAALAQAESWLTGVLLTVLADTGRSVVGADIARRPTITGYVRMLNAPSCSRCIILAGRFYRWNDGFLRHPRCDCKHIPAQDADWAKAEGFISDPYEAFKSMSQEQQDRVFGRIEARAIRDGADIYRIENTKLRGLSTAKSRARYGTPTKLTIDDIYRTAGTRKNALQMMADEGYITGPQVGGGNVIGQQLGFGALGKGGKARAASNAVLDANATGIRDPLNRYTMTAAERRLFDANYRLNEARLTGTWPRSIGGNSADKYTQPRPLTASDIATLEKDLANEIKKLNAVDARGKSTAPESVKRLARLLGLS